MAEHVASLFLDSTSLWDRTFRGAKDYTYVVEYKWKTYRDYVGEIQKRHQRRYGDFRKAMRRLDYLLVKYEVPKAFILGIPVDVPYHRKNALVAGAVCKECGGHNW